MALSGTKANEGFRLIAIRSHGGFASLCVPLFRRPSHVRNTGIWAYTSHEITASLKNSPSYILAKTGRCFRYLCGAICHACMTSITIVRRRKIAEIKICISISSAIPAAIDRGCSDAFMTEISLTVTKGVLCLPYL